MTYTSSLARLIQAILMVLSLVFGATSIPRIAAAASASTTKAVAVADTAVPAPQAARPIRTQKVDVTAYTSTVEECDSDPFITADGSDVADGIVATNFLPFGTKVRLPALFGDKVFVVHDRMNARYWYRVDIWMNDQKAMRKFGINRNVTLEIVEMGDGKTQWAKRAEQARLAKLEKAKVKTVLAENKQK